MPYLFSPLVDELHVCSHEGLFINMACFSEVGECGLTQCYAMHLHTPCKVSTVMSSLDSDLLLWLPPCWWCHLALSPTALCCCTGSRSCISATQWSQTLAWPARPGSSVSDHRQPLGEECPCTHSLPVSVLQPGLPNHAQLGNLPATH